MGITGSWRVSSTRMDFDFRNQFLGLMKHPPDFAIHSVCYFMLRFRKHQDYDLTVYAPQYVTLMLCLHCLMPRCATERDVRSETT